MTGYKNGKVEIWYGDNPPSNLNILWQKRVVVNGIESTLMYEYNNNEGFWQEHNSSAVARLHSGISDPFYTPSQFYKNTDVDDTNSVNKALEFVGLAGGGRVILPRRETPYIISSCLKMHSNTTLEVDVFAQIKLANESNSRMIENANMSTQEDVSRVDKNIAVIGGMWDGNGSNQSKKWDENPGVSSLMVGFHFSGVENLIFKPNKIINTKTYGCLFSNVKNLLIEGVDIDLELNESANNDGIHVLGNSENVTIQNCRIKSWDNPIAINADDVGHGPNGIFGDISNVLIQDIIIDNGSTSNDLIGGQGILLLCWSSSIRDVIIDNVVGAGSYFMRITSYNLGVGNGVFDNIKINNINYKWVGDTSSTYISLEGEIKNIGFSGINIYRGDEFSTGVTGINVETGSVIDNLRIDDVAMNNMTGEVEDLKYIIKINPCIINNVYVNNLFSKNNIAKCIPIFIERSITSNIKISNLDVDNATFGGLSLINTEADNVTCENILLDSSSDNIFNYVNDDVPNLKNLLVCNCGKINVLTQQKIDEIIVDGNWIGTYNPNLFGSDSAGETTYVDQQGYYSKNGYITLLQCQISWTGQTGTGQICVSLPKTVNTKSVNYSTVDVTVSGISVPAGGKVVGLIYKDLSRIQLYIQNAGVLSPLLLPIAEGSIYLSASYNGNA